ncbi:hypothetical protein QFC21_006810 [Naganishia friedmannii]|uniref:Uncharacterized protein n=1 Tax=Naganishia friedmannii TaxID=89922 RepID=A0ACC2V015_9TREE|nr:hypothetical protein QFC21_006810 [Naganishia friedmannii]
MSAHVALSPPVPIPLIRLPARYIHYAHSTLAAAAFGSALVLAMAMHYKQVVKNGVAGWPEEWVPSVSATEVIRMKRGGFDEEARSDNGNDECIGDWAPERPIFQIIIALCAGPRFLLILVQWLVTRRRPSSHAASDQKKSDGDSVLPQPVTHASQKWGAPEWIAIAGVLRTFTCGGWVYVTSTDHHVYHVPGAYSKYSLLEWTLVLLDVWFDALGAGEVMKLQIQIVNLNTLGAPSDPNGSSVPSDNSFALGPAVHASPLPGLANDARMEYSYAQSGWADTSPAGSKGPSSVWRVVAFLSDVYLYTCYWTIFTDLGLTLFYFSVWELALSGSELALLATLSPYLLCIPLISRFATSRRGQNVLRAAVLLAGMGAWALPGPTSKLFVIAFANVGLWMLVSATLARLRGSDAARNEALQFILGILVTVTLKFLNYSTNPLWCVVDDKSNGWNRTGAILALAAWVEKAYRSTTLEPQPDRSIPATMPTGRRQSSWGSALAFGSLLFLVQSFISDASTLVAWNWSGYPVNNQPEYLTHAPIVITCAAAGAVRSFVAKEYVGKDSASFAKHQTGIEYAALGFGACVLLCGRTSNLATYLPSWMVSERTGFYAGCVVVAYILRTLPLHFQSISASSRSATIFGHAMLWYIVLDVLSVVTVAYAFVPGGWLLRERGGLVILVAMALVVARERYLSNPSRAQGLKRVPGTAFAQRYAVRLLAVLVLTSWVFAYRTRHGMTGKKFTRVSAPGKPEELFTAGIWTVHFGVDLAGQESQRRQLELIRDLDLDIVGLLESDLHRFVYGNRDLTRMLVEELGYNVDLGPGPNKHTWGAAMLSRYPILESRHLLLPSPHGELAPAIHAKLLIANQTVNVIVSHNGQEEDALDRQLQTEMLAKVMGDAYPEPFVFLGYVVTHVGANRPAPYEILMSDGRVWDVEIEDQDRWCEYIAFRNLWRVGYARVSHGHITDTELQAAKFIIPSLYAPVDYTSNEQLYYHTYEDSIPEGWRFPQMFRGDGVRGHQYHVFDGPISYYPTDSFWVQWNKDHPAEAAKGAKAVTAVTAKE